MKRTYDETLKATVTLDDEGQVRGINHLEKFPEIEDHSQAAVVAYVRGIAEKFDITRESLLNPEQPVSFGDPRKQEVAYRFSEEKTFFDSTTCAYYQTYLNTPVWAAGITITINHDPARAIAATNTSERDIDAKLPSAKDINRFRKLFASGEKIDGTPPKSGARQSKAPANAGAKQLADILGEAVKEAKGRDDRKTTPTLIRGRFFVYRYDSEKRTSDDPTPKYDEREDSSTHDPDQLCCSTPPTLPIPPVPKSIQERQWSLVAELVFRLPHEGDPMDWRMLVDVKTNTILYLRALSSGVGTVKLMQIIPFWRRYLPTRKPEINDLETSACFCYAPKSVNLTKPRAIYIRLCTFGNVLANPLIGYVRELLFRFIQHVLF